MPLLTMLSNNNFDPSQFSNFINNVNNFTVDNFSINILKNILNLTISIFLIFLIKVIIQFISIWVSAKIAMNAQHFYSLKLYKSYLNKEYLFHLKNGPSKLFRNLMIEVNSFASSILFQSLTLLSGNFYFGSNIYFCFISRTKNNDSYIFYVFNYFNFILNHKKNCKRAG